MWASFEILGRNQSNLVRSLNLITSRNYAKDYYNILDIKRTSTRREIKHAYYRLSKKFHPDVNQEPNAEEKFKAIQEAYQILGDEKRRLEYDLSLNEGYYHGEPAAREEEDGSFTPRTYKKRGGVYTGSTSAYNFDEYYKSHYGQGHWKKSHMHASPKYYSSSKTMNQEELKNYWNTKEFSDENYYEKKRNEFFYRTIIIGVVLAIIYYVLKKAKESEEGIGMRTYIQNTQQQNSKKTS